MNKLCNTCQTNKPVVDFNKDAKKKDGLQYQCRACAKQYNRRNRKRAGRYQARHNKTIQGKLVKTYSGMQTRVKSLPSYQGLTLCTREEFYKWAETQPEFTRLYNQWVESNYDRSLSPSIDRIVNEKGYTLDNMQWLTVADNSKKG